MKEQRRAGKLGAKMVLRDTDNFLRECSPPTDQQAKADDLPPNVNDRPEAMPSSSMVGESSGALPVEQSATPTKQPASPAKLTPLPLNPRKERDRLIKKEQALRRKRREQALLEQAQQFHKEIDKSSQWHKQESLDEELRLKRFERDAVDAQKQNPATAGYEFTKSTWGNASRCSPVFWGHAAAFVPSSQTSKTARTPAVTTRRFIGGAQAAHPASFGFTMPRNNVELVSPMFFGVDFCKIPLWKVGLNKENVDDAISPQELLFNASEDGELSEQDREFLLMPAGKSRRAWQEEQAARLKTVLQQRFMPLTNGVANCCLVCKTPGGNTMGCPGCFEFSVTKWQRIGLPKQEATTTSCFLSYEQQQFVLESQLQQVFDVKCTAGLESPSFQEALRKEQTLRNEKTYYENVFLDQPTIQKYRNICKNYVQLYIKSLPTGSLVELLVDTKAPLFYIYELYRANFEEPNRRIHLLLPTTSGFFYLNETIERSSPILNAIVSGLLTLEDFNIPGCKQQTLVLFSVAILHEQSTSEMLVHYLRHNFSIQTPSRPLGIITVPNQMPRQVHQDEYQVRLASQMHRMMAFAINNKRMVVEELRQERRLKLIQAHHERMAQLIAAKKGSKPKLRSQKEMKGLAFFQFAMDDGNPESRLDKLWQCFQLFEQLKLCRNGKLLEAEVNEDTSALIALHQEATINTLDQVLHKTAGPLPRPILCINGTKVAIKLGTRLGAKEQDNREYGILLNLEEHQTPVTTPHADVAGPDGNDEAGDEHKHINDLATEQQETHLHAASAAVSSQVPASTDKDDTIQALDRQGTPGDSSMVMPSTAGSISMSVSWADLSPPSSSQATQRRRESASSSPSSITLSSTLVRGPSKRLQRTSTSTSTSDNGTHKSSRALRRKMALQAALQSQQTVVVLDLLTLQDVEWRQQDDVCAMYASNDVLVPPFHKLNWLALAKAYLDKLPFVALQTPHLEEFNALAEMLQNPQQVLSKKQIAKWHDQVVTLQDKLATGVGSLGVDHFHVDAPNYLQPSNSLGCGRNGRLALATKMLSRKGGIFKTRLQKRNHQIRQRELELAELQAREEALKRPQLSLAQKLKHQFIQDKAPKVHAFLDKTPLEKMGQLSALVLHKAAQGVVQVAQAAQKELEVHTL